MDRSLSKLRRLESWLPTLQEARDGYESAPWHVRGLRSECLRAQEIARLQLQMRRDQRQGKVSDPVLLLEGPAGSEGRLIGASSRLGIVARRSVYHESVKKRNSRPFAVSN